MSNEALSIDPSTDEEKGPKPVVLGQDKLSDLANGIVGWDSLEDSQNPQ